MIWFTLKDKLRKENNTYDAEEVIRMCEEICNSITSEDWMKYVKHVER